MKALLHILIKEARIKQKLKVKDIAQKLDVDSSLVSKFESGVRFPTLSQIHVLSNALKLPLKELMVTWLSAQLVKDYGKNEFVLEAFKVAENQISYNQKSSKKNVPKLLVNTIKEVDVLKGKLDELRKNDSHKIAEALEMEYTFNSNQIEGNTLTLQETSLVVKEGITIDGKSMREHLEAINHSDAIEFVKELVQNKTQITERIILQLHSLVLRGIDAKYAGCYRNVQVMISGSAHIPPAPYLVAKQMENLMQWYLEKKAQLHPVLLAAEMHERLVSIHPFIDGNGRTSRLLMNLILLQNGYVIADIKGERTNRLKYYSALESVRKTSKRDEFFQFIIDVELASIQRYLDILMG